MLLIFSDTFSDIIFLIAVGVFLITTVPSLSVIFSTIYGLYRVPPFITAENAVIICIGVIATPCPNAILFFFKPSQFLYELVYGFNSFGKSTPVLSYSPKAFK